MIQSMFNFFYGKLFGGQLEQPLGNKRRLEAPEEEACSSKIRRLDSDNSNEGSVFFSRRREPMACRPVHLSEARDGLVDLEDDECVVVADTHHNRWPTPSPRKAIRPRDEDPISLVYESTKENQPASTSLPPTMHSQRQELKITKTNQQEKGLRASCSTGKIFKTFRNTSNNIGPGRNLIIRQRDFSSIMRKQRKCLNESYRVEEKVNYMELLRTQTRLFSNSFIPFSASFKLKAKKPDVPIIDLTKEKSFVPVSKAREQSVSTLSTSNLKKQDDDQDDVVIVGEKKCESVNTLKEQLKNNPVCEESLVAEIVQSHRMGREEKMRLVAIEQAKVDALKIRNRRSLDEQLEKRLQEYMKLTEPAIEESKTAYELPPLTPDQESRVSSALVSKPLDQVLINKYSLQITRRSIQSLQGLNWLNDEVINFYMNLIMERSKAGGLPNVYAMNTFFYPKVMSNGHQSVKRWTKKVDIFAQDLVLVPVHLGVHWCMAVIDLRSKEVRYYDSMKNSNNKCLRALLQYLEAESLDKKKQPLDTSQWKQMNVDNIPEQMNGSDCGVFSCMFAEHISRDCDLLFSQDQMPYFRRKMILEIIDGKLIT